MKAMAQFGFAVALIALGIPHAMAQERNLAQERECGNQAARVFAEEWDRPLRKEWGQDYRAPAWESHYNSALNRCLILITWLSPMTKEIRANHQQGWVIDADTRHVFAEYFAPYPLKEKEISMCVIEGKGFACREFEEFQELVSVRFGFPKR
jgi:hypothetical protein